MSCRLSDVQVPVRLLQLLCRLHHLGVTYLTPSRLTAPKSDLCRQGQGRGTRKGSSRGTVLPITRQCLDSVSTACQSRYSYWPAKHTRTLYHSRFGCTRKLSAIGVKAVVAVWKCNSLMQSCKSCNFECFPILPEPVMLLQKSPLPTHGCTCIPELQLSR